MPLMTQATAVDLHHWSDRLESRAELPRLIRKLILSGSATINRIAMPAGEGVQLSGWDGLVDFDGADPWVPTGVSVWEMGTNKDPRRKAREDYTKRKADPGGVQADKVTFVFVTPRSWPGKKKWVDKCQADGIWKEVRAYDAQDLEAWLEYRKCPAFWFLERIGKYVPGLRTVENFWDDFVHSTEPTLNEEIVAADRQEQLEQVVQWLSGPESVLELSSESPLESAVFVAAVLQSLPEEEGEAWLARAVVAETQEAWRVLARYEEPLLIVLRVGDLTGAGQLRRVGHRVIVPLGRDTGPSDKGIILSRPGRESFSNALQSIGLGKSRAKSVTRECGRSLLVLQRRFGVAEALARPPWSRVETAATLAPCLLAGSWSEEREGDREVLSRLAGKPYEEFARELGRWVHEPDAPFRRVGPVWRLTAPLDAWLLLARHVNRDHLAVYRSVVFDVLGALDPSFDLPADKRWAASIHGKSAPYSGWLREHLAEGLVLLGIYGKQAAATTPGRPEDWVSTVVAELLRDICGVRWASIQDLLPLLAEAAPESVISSIEAALEGEPPPILFLFQEEGDAIFGRCNHSGLLWALENMAWNPAYLSRVVSVLGSLARLDPGGTWSNRPAASLKDILLSWQRHTAADVEERLCAIDYLVRMEPDVGWKLMIDLLPGGHDTTSGTHEPRWRDWAQGVSETIPVGERKQYLFALADRALVHLGDSGQRRSDLLAHLRSLPDEWGSRVIDDLDRFSRECTQEEQRVLLWGALRDLLHHHRGFPSAEWALPEQTLERLSSIYDRLSPQDPITRVGWLFDDGWPPLLDNQERDYRETQELVSAARRDAILGVYATGGFDLLLNLVRSVAYPHAVGLHSAEVLSHEEIDARIFADVLGSPEEHVAAFGGAFLVNRREQSSNDWIDKTLARAKAEGWASGKRIDFCLSLPETMESWKRVHKLGAEVECGYWSKTTVWKIDNDTEALRVAVEHLLHVRRTNSAFKLVEFSNVASELSFDLLARILESLFVKAELGRKLAAHEIERVFKALDKTTDWNAQRAAQLEWQFLPALEHTGRGPKTLHEFLENDPLFFAQAVSWIYRSDKSDDQKQEEMPDDAAKNRAHAAYDLLHSWKGVPGVGVIVDEQRLIEWIDTARTQLSITGHHRIGDQQIGKVLARVPTDEDEEWPCISVRNIVERIRSGDLERGIYIGVLNARGSTTRGLGAGGVQERELEARYSQLAKQAAALWPRTSSVLARLANNYAAEARDWDESAERDDLRFE